MPSQISSRWMPQPRSTSIGSEDARTSKELKRPTSYVAKAEAAAPEDTWAPPTIAGFDGLRKERIRTLPAKDIEA